MASILCGKLVIQSCSAMPLDQKQKKYNDLITYGSLGLEMLVSVFIGTLGGYGLDRLLQTKPWLMIVGFIFGSAAGFRSLLRLLDKENSKKGLR